MYSKAKNVYELLLSLTVREMNLSLRRDSLPPSSRRSHFLTTFSHVGSRDSNVSTMTCNGFGHETVKLCRVVQLYGVSLTCLTSKLTCVQWVLTSMFYEITCTKYRAHPPVEALRIGRSTHFLFTIFSDDRQLLPIALLRPTPYACSHSCPVIVMINRLPERHPSQVMRPSFDLVTEKTSALRLSVCDCQARQLAYYQSRKPIEAYRKASTRHVPFEWFWPPFHVDMLLFTTASAYWIDLIEFH